MNWINKWLRKPITLHLYTDRPDVMQQAQPTKAAGFFPKWWKKLPLELPYDSGLGWSSTMKRCEGFTQLFQHGIILPLWSDLAIEIGPKGMDTARWNFADTMTHGISHPQVQRGDYLPATEYFHFKITCPWLAFCDEDVPWVFMQPMWNFDNLTTFAVPPAIVDFKYQHGLQVNTFFPRTDKAVIHRIDHGQPLAHLVPLTERRVIVKHHLVTTQELQMMDASKPTRFTKTYRHNKEAGSCPFK